jgi:hypothetical protein
MTPAENHQVNLERQQRLEEALRRAINYCASDDDWAVIYYECGVSARLRKEHESDSESRI